MITRRGWLQGAAMGLAAGATGCARPPIARGPEKNSAVSIVHAASYDVDLVERMRCGVAALDLDVKGKRVLLKPNLVEFDPAGVIHTEAAVLAAAVELFESLGAAEVLIGEGPGHRRDTTSLAEQAGYLQGIPRFNARFTDLNRDDVAAVRGFPGLDRIYLPRTTLGVDLIVSVARMKTHHWAGATLAMKNLFGLVPGSLYGWPKNKLHQLGIDRSVAALYRQFPRSFAIVDGIVGMEGNGPVQGRPRHCGALVMGADLAAVDATCCRIMGIEPEKIGYLRLASAQGHIRPERIEQRAETISSVFTPFDLIPEFWHVRLG